MSALASRKADPREVPSYSTTEAAHYLCLPATTLRAWVLGQKYGQDREKREYKPLIQISDRDTYTLSFFNLVEAHVLKAIRREHHISMQTVRRALQWLKKTFPSERPLADHRFATDGVELFVAMYGKLINLSRPAQVEMEELLLRYLHRIDRDPSGVPRKLFPFTRPDERTDPGSIELDPQISFGRPVLRGTGIPTQVIAERYKAGDSVKDLARDYERTQAEIEEALRCELHLQAA